MVYKIISKILVNRISSVMDDIISPEQATFVLGRKMKHNVLLIQELMRGYSKKRTSLRCILKIDLVKVYDTVS